MVNEVCLRTLDLDRPWLLEQYRSRGGYEVLAKILKENTPPEEIVEEIKRGPARPRRCGFPHRSEVELHRP